MLNMASYQPSALTRFCIREVGICALLKLLACCMTIGFLEKPSTVCVCGGGEDEFKEAGIELVFEPH
jgi:hypothetical protein